MNGGSVMDSDKLRGRNLMSRYSPAKGQQMGLSSSTSLVGKDGCNNRVGIGDRESDMIIERWKKEGARGLKWRSVGVNGDVEGGRSEGEEKESFQSIREASSCAAGTASGVAGRKKIKLHEKEESESVDAPLVPRKLRTAMNKRGKRTASPPLPDVKKKSRHTSDWAQAPCANGVKKSNDCLLVDSITEDEKVVVQALFNLSVLQPSSSIEKQQKELLDFKADIYTAPTPSKVSSKDNNVELQTDVNAAKDDSVNADVDVLAKTVLNTQSQPSMQDPEKSVQSDIHALELSSRNDDLDTTKISKNTVYTRTSLGVLHDLYPASSVIQQTQHDAFRLETARVDHETRAIEYIESSKNIMCSKGATSYCEVSAPSIANGQPTIKSGHSPFTNSSRSIASRSDLPTEKLTQKDLGVTQSWKKCAIHMHISHLIRDYQKKEKEQIVSLATDRSKSRGEKKLIINTSCETTRVPNGMSNISSARNVPSAMKSKFEAKNIINLEDENDLPTKPPTVSSETHVRQKQAHDFLSLSTSTGAGGSGYCMKSLGQVQSSFLHPPAPHHSIMRFPFPHIPYATSSAPVAATQVQLHVPHYVANSYYGPPQMANIGATSKLQQYQQQQHQHMWEAHLAQYRQQMGAQFAQNGQLDPSLCLNGQPSSTIPPSSTINSHGGSYRHPQSTQQQHMFFTSSVPPSRNKIHQEQASALRHEEPPQLQLLCNAHR